MNNIQVAIDGPAGSGKSSISKIVAKKLNFTHIDTGAMFRAITLYALDKNINLEDESSYDFLNEIEIKYANDIIYLNGRDVTTAIRSDIVTNNVSAVSKIKAVRDKMVHLERIAASEGYILMDGRDIGTVVLPNADVKIFLTASVEERAKRRFKELIEKGRTDLTLENVKNDIISRDLKDSTREIAPLKKADDATLVDTTSLTIDEVCDQIIKIILLKVGKVMSEETKEITSMDDVEIAKNLRRGQIVSGTVVSVQDKVAYLDLQQFTEGKIYLDHFTLDKNVDSLKDLCHVGDVLEVEITKVAEGDDNGEILCSRLNLLKAEKFNEFPKYLEEQTSFEVKVERLVEGKGYNVSAFGFRFFLPLSQARKETKVGSKIKVCFFKLDENKQTGIVSERVLVEKELNANRENELANIHEGDVLKGRVVKILPFACFVKFNYVEGMLRLPELSHTFVEKIEDVVSINDEIEVKVISTKNGKLQLSRKALLATPFEEFAKDNTVGKTITGKVVNKLPYGLLLEVAPNVRGLLHSSEYSWNPNDNFASCVKIGDEVEVCISQISVENEKLSLSRKALIDNPWSRVEARVGDVCDCKVVEILEKGLLVETLGVNGFVHQSQLSNKKLAGKLEDLYAVGDEFKAVITDINPREWRLQLSVRKLLELEEKKEYAKYLDNSKKEDNYTIGDMFEEVLKK